VLGWTFASPAQLDRLGLPADDPRRAAPALENPLSEDQSLLRTTLLGSLLDVAAHNAARGMTDLRLFETGTVFLLAEPTAYEGKQTDAPARESGVAGVPLSPDAPPDGWMETGVMERHALGVLLSGAVVSATWGAPEPPRADLFAVKAVLEALGEALRVPLQCARGAQPFLHPGRSADVLCGGERIGWLGELHPLMAREWDLEGAAVMELDLDRLLAASGAGHEEYRDAISFPALRQDLAVVLPVEAPAAQALDVVRRAGGDLLDEVRVFDVYSGPQVGEGRRSLALSLSFRAPDRTLADEDVAPLRAGILAALEELGGELRG
jgi:phenylalanyl-tRNA synthetase beta chain